MEHKLKINSKPLNAQKADMFDMQNLLAEKEEQGGKSCAMLQFVPKLQNSMISIISMRGRPLDKGSKGTGMLRHYGIRWNGKRKIENGKLETVIARAINDQRAEDESVSDIRLMRAGQDSPWQSSLLLTIYSFKLIHLLTFLNQGGVLC